MMVCICAHLRGVVVKLFKRTPDIKLEMIFIHNVKKV